MYTSWPLWAVFVCVISPVAPLWQTFQDIITEAELVISLTAVDALQGDPHQLVRVPDDLLLALQQPGRLMSAVHKYMHQSTADTFSTFVRWCCILCACVCSVCFGVAAATCPWLLPDRVINITSTAQGCSTGLDAAQTASQTTAARTLVARV